MVKQMVHYVVKRKKKSYYYNKNAIEQTKICLENKINDNQLFYNNFKNSLMQVKKR